MLVIALTPLIEKVSNWIEKNPQLAAGIVIAIGAIGALLIVISAIATVAGVVVAAIAGSIDGKNYLALECLAKIKLFAGS